MKRRATHHDIERIANEDKSNDPFDPLNDLYEDEGYHLADECLEEEDNLAESLDDIAKIEKELALENDDVTRSKRAFVDAIKDQLAEDIGDFETASTILANTHSIYDIGQCWFSGNELELGLGVIENITDQIITLFFSANQTHRNYLINSSETNLIRASFKETDEIQLKNNEIVTIKSILNHGKTYRYQVKDAAGLSYTVHEKELSGFTKYNDIELRIVNGLYDNHSWFKLRYDALHYSGLAKKSPYYGWQGSRIHILPHQIAIAYQAAHKIFPRLLLADEVGLGKTIEAGLILRHRLITYQAKSALLIVPQHLCTQWLIELKQRFDIRMSLFDYQRYQEIKDKNPFESDQCVLISFEVINQYQKVRESLIQRQWDLVIVDEAHNLFSSAKFSKIEVEFISTICKKSPGVLLLSATPQQLGLENYFKLLQFLDPHRFSDFNSFVKEQNNYSMIADILNCITKRKKLSFNMLEALQYLVTKEDYQAITEYQHSSETFSSAKIKELTSKLIDYHGLNNFIFKNTRQHIKVFPKKILHSYELELPKAYQETFTSFDFNNHSFSIFLEELYSLYSQDKKASWLDIDPRVEWLKNKLNEIATEKVLLICASAKTAIELHNHLSNQNRACGVFHESMSLIQRDRVAAAFASKDQFNLLICSEIGSEGRNFQFCHHLILFDLPAHGDVLAQRIGRLDRIGQKQTIHIHVPIIKQTAQAILFKFYDTLNCFTTFVESVDHVFEKLKTELYELLQRQTVMRTTLEIEAFITKVKETHHDYLKNVCVAKDRLLEYQPTQGKLIKPILAAIEAQNHNEKLIQFSHSLLENYGIELDQIKNNLYSIKPRTDMSVEYFPGIKDEEIFATFDRKFAIDKEGLEYLTFEHTIIKDGIELLLLSANGKVSFVELPHYDNNNLHPQDFLLECIYNVTTNHPKHLQLSQFLPALPIRILIHSGRGDLAKTLSLEEISKYAKDKKDYQIDSTTQALLLDLLTKSKALAIKKTKLILKHAEQSANAYYQRLSKRLCDLHEINKSIPQNEIEATQHLGTETIYYLQQTKPQLEAVRIIKVI